MAETTMEKKITINALTIRGRRRGLRRAFDLALAERRTRPQAALPDPHYLKGGDQRV